MKEKLYRVIHPVLMDRESTMTQKEQLLINKTRELILDHALELVLAMGFTSKGLENNLALKNFCMKYDISREEFKQLLIKAGQKVRHFQPSKTPY